MLRAKLVRVASVARCVWGRSDREFGFYFFGGRWEREVYFGGNNKKMKRKKFGGEVMRKMQKTEECLVLYILSGDGGTQRHSLSRRPVAAAHADDAAHSTRESRRLSARVHALLHPTRGTESGGRDGKAHKTCVIRRNDGFGFYSQKVY